MALRKNFILRGAPELVEGARLEGRSASIQRGGAWLQRLLILAGIVISLSTVARADNAPDGWTEFHSEHGGFTVLMPPGEAHESQKPAGDLDATNERHAIVVGDSVFLVNLTLFKPDTVDPVAGFFLLSADNLVELGDGDTVRVERRFELQGHSAVEVVVDRKGDRTLSLRAYVLGGDRIVQTLVLGPKGSDTSDDTKRFLDSFKLN